MSKTSEIDMYLQQVDEIMRDVEDMNLFDAIDVIVEINDLTPGDRRNIIHFWHKSEKDDGI